MSVQAIRAVTAGCYPWRSIALNRLQFYGRDRCSKEFIVSDILIMGILNYLTDMSYIANFVIRMPCLPAHAEYAALNGPRRPCRRTW